MLDVLSDGFIIVLPKKKFLVTIHHSPTQNPFLMSTFIIVLPKKFPLVERKKRIPLKNPFPTILQLLKGKLNQQTNKFLFFPSIFSLYIFFFNFELNSVFTDNSRRTNFSGEIFFFQFFYFKIHLTKNVKTTKTKNKPNSNNPRKKEFLYPSRENSGKRFRSANV